MSANFIPENCPILSVREETILKTVTKQERSGKEIGEVIDRVLGIKMSAGSLYPALGSLTKKKLVRKRKIKNESFYLISDQGIKYFQLRAEQDRRLAEEIVSQVLQKYL